MSVPERLGRYRVIAPLAAGGMAEVFLAALEGGAGFARPVVIKRVLPHLAKRRDLRVMFVDEARIVIGLRHPNIVSVLELGQEDGELYLVMEYLEGEGADAVVRRLGRAARPMPVSVACHIVAEAALGLHAAHEHKDETGKSLGIVHRDVSPHNLFVSYEGGIKVIDFGVARAENRDSRTDTGTIKGKLAYMSPEQVEGADVDRRTDVFALGTILHELLTGTRLFHRNNHAETVRAVLGADIPPPSQFRHDVPASLDAIVLRALSRDLARRYSTASELRRELLLTLRALAPEALPQEETAALMHELFADRLSAKRAMLHALSTGARLTSVPAGDPDAIEEIDPGPALEATGSPSPTMETSVDGIAGRAQTTFTGRSRAARRTPLVALGAATVLVLSALAWAWSGRSSAPTPPPSPVDPEPTAATAPAAAPPPREPPPAVPSSPAPPPASVRVTITSEPAEAEVRIDGEVVGRTPVSLERPRADVPSTLAVVLPGYVPIEETLPLDEDASRSFVLVRERSSARGVGATGRSRPPAERPPADRGFFRVE